MEKSPASRRQIKDAGTSEMIETGETILPRLRKVCLRLTGATETITFGHPTFQVASKTFAVLEEYKGELGIAMKVEKTLQPLFLNDTRFFQTPYIGKHGWVTLRMNPGPLDWKEIAQLVEGSYQLVKPRSPSSARRSRA